MKDDRLYLVHILQCIERIALYTQEGRAIFLADIKTQDAVLRNLQILAESAQRLSDDLKSRYAQVDWRTISAFRNVIVHDYLGIDLERTWDTVRDDLPELKAQVEAILSTLG